MSRKNTILYVGGLDSQVTEDILHSAFIPFGELKSIQIPKDYTENKSKGFAFVEFDLEEDALDALDNMDGSELFGKVLKCNVAKALPKGEKGKAIWNAEEWIQNSLKDNVEGAITDDGLHPQNLVPTS